MSFVKGQQLLHTDDYGVTRKVEFWSYIPRTGGQQAWVYFNATGRDRVTVSYLTAVPTTEELPGQNVDNLLAAKNTAGSEQAARRDNVDKLMQSAVKKPSLPIDSKERKQFPLYSGLFAYFPAALAQVANHSFINNEKHNPGKPLQHSRGNSGDHADCILRHLTDAAEQQPGSATQIEELRGVAWRALAILQEACELGGTKPAPAATFPEEE